MRQFFNFVFLLCEWVLHHLYWSATQEYGCYMCREYAKVGNVCETNACENYVIFKICVSWTLPCIVKASCDPSAHGRGQVKSNTLTCAPCNNSCVPNQIAGKCEIFIILSRPEHGPESVLRCDRSRPGSWLFHHEARATSGRRVTAHREVPCILITHGIEWLTTRTIDGPSTGNTRSNTVGRHAYHRLLPKPVGKMAKTSLPETMPDVLARGYA